MPSPSALLPSLVVRGTYDFILLLHHSYFATKYTKKQLK